MTDGVRADLAGIGLELKLVDTAFAAAVRRNVRAAVTECGAGILDRVRAEASWSSRIPAATKLTTSFAVNRSGITIRTSAAKAPHARPLEVGNADGSAEDHAEAGRRIAAGHALSKRAAFRQLRHEGSMGRVNRHPVYRRGGYANQPTRPYFFSAVEAMTPETEAAFAAAIEKAVREAGFH